MTELDEHNRLGALFESGAPDLLEQQQAAARRAAQQADGQRRREQSRPRRSESLLRDIAVSGRARLHGSGVGAPDEATTDQVLHWTIEQFGDRIAVASSMADTVVAHLVSQYKPWVDVLFGDTGYHFEETLQTRQRVADTLKVNVISVLPAQSVAEQDASYGPRLYQRDPTECCRLRKVVPLRDRLADYEVWITGLRRDDAPSRANAPLVVWDQANKLVKVNPIAAWSDERVAAYIRDNDVIVNPLLSQGYPSIGCAPCTSRVAPGEDTRSGRWAGQTKTECGLHVI